MKQCRNCGANMDDQAKFCTSCGTEFDSSTEATTPEENTVPNGSEDNLADIAPSETTSSTGSDPEKEGEPTPDMEDASKTSKADTTDNPPTPGGAELAPGLTLGTSDGTYEGGKKVTPKFIVGAVAVIAILAVVAVSAFFMLSREKEDSPFYDALENTIEAIEAEFEEASKEIGLASFMDMVEKNGMSHELSLGMPFAGMSDGSDAV